jgi:nucleoside-diphosphate-sugar epimerase
MVFVTGGTGFLGSHLIHALLANGKSVRALKRETSSFELFDRVFSFYNDIPASAKNRIEWVTGDLGDVVLLENFMHNVSEIYHAAGLVSFQPGDKQKLMKVNIDGTANLVNAALHAGSPKFCYVSSIAALGRADDHTLINEQAVWKSTKRNSNYAVSKYGAEREVWRGMEEGLNAFVVNPSVILGPGETNSGLAKMVNVVMKGLRFYSTGTNGFVDVRDVVRVMIGLMENGIEGERFIVSEGNHSYREIFSLIAGETGKKPPMVKAGKTLSNMAWILSWLQGKLMNQKPLITRETAITANSGYRYDNARIRETLKYSFIPVNETIKQSCRFYLKQKG